MQTHQQVETNMTDTSRVTRSSFPQGLLTFPENMEPFVFHESFTQEEFETIAQGLRSNITEEKNIAFLEDHWLYIIRSWTGDCYLKVQFHPKDNQWIAKEAYKLSGFFAHKPWYLSHLLRWIIRNLLLGQPLAFPKAKDTNEKIHTSGLFQHLMAGTGIAEKIVDEDSPFYEINTYDYIPRPQ